MLRIEQYFQLQDYALWDVIKNGNSFKPAAKTTTNADGTSTTLIPGLVTTKEKVQKKNDMKVRSMFEIDEDPDISLVQHDAEVQGRHEHDMEPDFEFTTAEKVYTAKKEVSTAEPVSTAGASVSTTGASSAKDKGKAIIEEAETAEIDEEERQRIARVQEEASSFNIKEWDDIEARVEANEELAQRLQSEERKMHSEAEKTRLLAEFINKRKRYFTAQRAKERRNKPLTQAQQRTYMRVYTFVLMESESERVIPEFAAGSFKRDAEEELVQKSLKRQKTRESSEPVEEPKDKEEEELSQERIQQIMIIVPEVGIYMLVEREYPLSRGVLTQMLVAKLLVEQDNEMSRELLRKIFMQEEMDLETAQITTTAKLPTLKHENGNSFKPASKTTTNADGTSTTLIPGLITTEEKVQKKNDMKTRRIRSSCIGLGMGVSDGSSVRLKGSVGLLSCREWRVGVDVQRSFNILGKMRRLEGSRGDAAGGS
ncbi:hypothetical protein Tco_1313088 [Tanacetum coccineum]